MSHEITQPEISTPEEMAQALGKMVFGEVGRLQVISDKLCTVEDDLLEDVLTDLELPIAVRLKIYEAMANRRTAGQNFILRFVQLLDGRGPFTDPNALEGEKQEDADMEGDLELSDDQKKQLATRLRKMAGSKILHAHGNAKRTIKNAKEVVDVETVSVVPPQRANKIPVKVTTKKKVAAKKAAKKKTASKGKSKQLLKPLKDDAKLNKHGLRDV